jgi:hypothetical protein
MMAAIATAFLPSFLIRKFQIAYGIEHHLRSKHYQAVADGRWVKLSNSSASFAPHCHMAG